MAMLQLNVDSLKELLRLQEENFGDSLAYRDGLYRSEIGRLVGFLDSAVAHPKPRPEPKTAQPPPQTTKPKSTPKPEVAERVIEEEPDAVTGENETVVPANAKKEPVQITKPSESETIDPELSENVLTFYGKLYEGLPKDLTSPERKVALYEISIKTAAEYSITMPQLKEICDNYYLSY